MKPTAAEKRHMGKVAALGCVVCRNIGNGPTPALVHHCFYGAGKRDKHYLTIPLCKYHHQDGTNGEAIHTGHKTFEARYGTEEALLNQTIGEL